MKVLVCGSRGWTDVDAVYTRLAELPALTTVIHGAARGADQIAAQACNRLGQFYVFAFPADWTHLGKRAGIERNLRMLRENPDRVIAFWDGKSKGTAHTIMEANKRGIPVEVIQP